MRMTIQQARAAARAAAIGRQHAGDCVNCGDVLMSWYRIGDRLKISMKIERKGEKMAPTVKDDTMTSGRKYVGQLSAQYMDKKTGDRDNGGDVLMSWYRIGDLLKVSMKVERKGEKMAPTVKDNTMTSGKKYVGQLCAQNMSENAVARQNKGRRA